MQWLRSIRARRFALAIAAEQEFYSRPWSAEGVAGWQLARFNELWRTIRNNVPYFNVLAEERKLPPTFASWSEFSTLLPPMDRHIIQRQGGQLCDASRPPEYLRTTGGSTGQPVQLPAWRAENGFSECDSWFARSWFGVTPADRLFLIWGHSHLLGGGWRGRLNRLKREVKDSILGYHRQSAYDLSEAVLRQAGENLLRFKPAYVLGYSVALDRFARVNADRRSEFHKLGLKVAIATAESFPRADSAVALGDILGCPVAMEYGAVEMGPMAHQTPGGNFSVFWRHYFVEGIESREVPHAREILVTALYPRCSPLVRYKVGDLIVPVANSTDVAREFASVTGRCNDSIVLADGTVIHSEAFTHAIKECPGVSAFQVIQDGSGRIRMSYVLIRGSNADESEIVRRLSLIHPALGGIEIQQVTGLSQTVAGKTRRVVRDHSAQQ